MKYLLSALLGAFTFSTFASDSISDVVSRIETDRQVRCEFVKKSLAVCFGSPAEIAFCRFSVLYRCTGAEKLDLKLNVNEFYNANTNSRETIVTKIKYIK